MRAKEFLYENDAAFTKGQYNVKWFPNEEDPGGVYIVFKDRHIERHSCIGCIHFHLHQATISPNPKFGGDVHRLATGGMPDRNALLQFRFDGKDYTGFAGDTLASALLACGVKRFGRSFKYHRPRGIFSAGVEEPNALVELREGARREPNTRATVVELFDGLVAHSQNRWPLLSFDLGAAADQPLHPVVAADAFGDQLAAQIEQSALLQYLQVMPPDHMPANRGRKARRHALHFGVAIREVVIDGRVAAYNFNVHSRPRGHVSGCTPITNMNRCVKAVRGRQKRPPPR